MESKFHQGFSFANIFTIETNSPLSEDASKWTASVGTQHHYDWVHRYIINPFGWLLQKPEWRTWRYGIERIYKHPDFQDNGMLYHDIALLKLDGHAPVDSHPYVDLLPLPTADDVSIPTPLEYCIVTGWGCTADGGTLTDEQNWARIAVLPRSECKLQWPRMSDNQFCAGRPGEGVAVCSGDSGGPLECKNGTHSYLAGIISFASSEEPEQHSSGFTYVAKYVSWIKSIIS